jgi:hypothetical protein
MTTGELQQRVYLAGERRPGRALIVGAEHVSFSAMVTLAHAGADVVALVTDRPGQQSYAAFALAAAVRWRVPVWTSTAVRRVTGRGRLAAVELEDLRTGTTRLVECDTLVFTGDWIPDHELARLAGPRSTPVPAGPRWTPGCRRPFRSSSRRATWCMRRRPRTSPPSAAGTPPGISRPCWRAITGGLAGSRRPGRCRDPFL